MTEVHLEEGADALAERLEAATAPLTTVPMPAPPHCYGEQWIIAAEADLARLCSIVLIGQTFHAAEVLSGTQAEASVIAPDLKAQLDKELHPTTRQTIEHRDGLLFEIICWVAQRIGIGGDEAVKDPHLKSTNQGTDGFKVTVDRTAKTLLKATVYEYKCTENPRQLFQSKVLDAFREYVAGKRDNQLAQSAAALLQELGFTGKDLKRAYDTLIKGRPLAFQASLTVSPSTFPAAKCRALFKDYDSIPVAISDRFGNTLPLNDIRAWFATFSEKVWEEINSLNLTGESMTNV
jgi:hypothetical protein